MMKANRPTRAEEWRDPEPPGHDDYTVPPFDEPLVRTEER